MNSPTYEAVMSIQLDYDFTNATYCNDQPAAHRLLTASKAGNMLAEAYLVQLCNSKRTYVCAWNKYHFSDNGKLLLWLQMQLDNRNVFVQNILGSFAQTETDFLRCKQSAADKGHSGAQNEMGLWCLQQAHRPSEAFVYFESAAKHFHPDAENNLGICYLQGIGCRVDNIEALKYFKRAASKGHSCVYGHMGWCNFNTALFLTRLFVLYLWLMIVGYVIFQIIYTVFSSSIVF